MQDLEPYYHWRNLYTAEEDPRSPFYEKEYSEFCDNYFENDTDVENYCRAKHIPIDEDHLIDNYF